MANYSISKNFYSVKYRDVWFCFNSLMGKYVIADQSIYSFFQLLKSHSCSLSQLKIKTRQKNLVELLKEYIRCGLIIKEGTDEMEEIRKQKRKQKNELKRNNKIFFIGFTTTDKCNFGCGHCVKLKRDLLCGRGKEFTLNWKTAKKVLDYFFSIVLNSNKKLATIGFTGGEPLINFDVIKKIVKYTEKNLSPHKKVNFTITTNGVLINDEIARFMARHQFIVGISLDGLKKANDAVRIYKNGKGTFDDILKSIMILEKYMDIGDKNKMAISTCLFRKNFSLVNNDFLDFIKGLGVKKLNLEADLIDLVHSNYQEVLKKLFSLYKYGHSIGLIIYGYWSKPFFTLLSNKRTPVAFCAPMRGEAVAVAPEGKIQPCVYIYDLMFQLDKFKKINTFSRYGEFLAKNWKGNLEECKNCELEGVCLGGCYVTRSMPNREVFKYRCYLNKKITPLLIRHFLETNYEKIKKEFSKS